MENTVDIFYCHKLNDFEFSLKTTLCILDNFSYFLVVCVLFETRNVSIGHRCPRYCQIRINRELSLTKGNNS